MQIKLLFFIEMFLIDYYRSGRHPNSGTTFLFCLMMSKTCRKYMLQEVYVNLKHEDSEGIKAESVNTVVFILHQIKRRAFFLHLIFLRVSSIGDGGTRTFSNFMALLAL